MRKKRLVITVIVTVVLLALLSGVAGAFFTANATAVLSGKTGRVSIQTWNVTLTQRFQPGDTQYVWIKVHNNGNCPIVITSAGIFLLPSYLGANFHIKPTGRRLNPCESAHFKLYVHMPQATTGPQDRPFSFQIRFSSRNLPTAWPAVGP